MSMPPNSANVCSIIRSHSASSATSVGTTSAAPPAAVIWSRMALSRASFLAANTTFAPWAASSNDRCWPRPCDAPVTSTTLSCSLIRFFIGCTPWMSAIRRAPCPWLLNVIQELASGVGASQDSRMPRNRQHIDRETRVAGILDAAEELLLRDGYEPTTMAAVARAAGVASNSVYWYFPGKDDLLAAVLQRRLDRASTRLDTESSEPLPL